jgi:hypothetical protein
MPHKNRAAGLLSHVAGTDLLLGYKSAQLRRITLAVSPEPGEA